MSVDAGSGGPGAAPPVTMSSDPVVSNGSGAAAPTTGQAVGGGLVDRATAAAAVSPKVTWAAVASALATIIWTLIASLAPTAFSGAAVATLTGATATVLTFLGAYFARDPLRDH